MKALETPVELNSVTVHMIREAADGKYLNRPAEKEKLNTLNCNIKSDSHTEKAYEINYGAFFYSVKTCSFLMRLPNKTDIIKKTDF